MDWSDYIAIYAAFIGTAVFIWEGVRWWLSQARITVAVGEGYFINDPAKKPKVFIRIINKGDKDIVLHGIVIKGKDGKTLFTGKKAEKVGARNCHTVPIDKERITEHAEFPLIAWATDAVGKRYRSKGYKTGMIFKEGA